MKHIALNIKKADSKETVKKLSCLNDLLLKTDISYIYIDEMPIDRLYEANSILNSIIFEAKTLIKLINNQIN